MFFMVNAIIRIALNESIFKKIIFKFVDDKLKVNLKIYLFI